MFQYICSINASIFAVGILTFVIGGCMIISSLVKDIKIVIKSFNKYIKAMKNPKKCLKQIFEFINLHSSAKQLCKLKYIFVKTYFIHKLTIIYHPHFPFRLVREFSIVYRPIFVYVSFWGIAALCETMLTLMLELVEYFISIISVVL